MPKTKSNQPVKTATAAPAVQSHAVRETVESIVIAFVLAFLFRTFEAEAFVIPTGSMAPTLMGRHKDVDCPKCGYRYQVSASEEESENKNQQTVDCIAGQCPMCHYVLPMRPDLPAGVPELRQGEIPLQPSYNGDRILVNKYIYAFSDPKRWDVVVFKFPGDAKVNYIKRLVGLPGEKLRIYQGDIFVEKTDAATKKSEFEIIRKPPAKVLSMRQLVHDTNYDPVSLEQKGWPLRWHAPTSSGANAWTAKTDDVGNNVRQIYSVDAAPGADSWLRYEHLVPTYNVWRQIAAADERGDKNKLFSDKDRTQSRRLITDANPYDGRLLRNLNNDLEIDAPKQGIHWVSDLMLEADVDVQSSAGELLLDLVEAGKAFTCRINLEDGQAKLSAEGLPNYGPIAQTSIKGPGKHRVAFSNFDDQLLLWVDGKPIEFKGSTEYSADAIFGGRENMLPTERDLAPAGIGARGAKLSVSRLKVWRDLYYIAESSEHMRPAEPVTDFQHDPRSGHEFDPELYSVPTNPNLWKRLSERKKVEFSLNNEQLFVMGDNSAESSDARLWLNPGPQGQRPGGAYLEKRLLIGKALCVYWPHSWNRIPGTPIPFPLFPNVGDMRLVK